ncbi:NADH-quinone oxidoreductase subunit C [Neorickettsia sp. 179522]|uniref:NADH-quinone oxidoreductase subunit C n=1 Tax=Neorickettsia sp. 179522 TaxID=1714371 RepID=UPI00079736A5|nr:NADH-quinone oxidoreductase subunit C [Neorickettsia sp. 179522]KYH12504.1 NADH-quinone oxidoreductase subunit C [Neorickettsia sp. 179522]
MAIDTSKVDALINAPGQCVISSSLESLVELISYLSSCGFEQLVDIFGIDYLEREKRIEVVYLLLDLKNNRRCCVKVCVDPVSEKVPTCCGIFSVANWFEREVYDMYGVVFESHPDLRRILTDYGFEGFPMLKDFPLTGYKEVRYDLESKEVVYEKVDLSQDYRSFDSLTPWEGAGHLNLPLDGKKE